VDFTIADFVADLRAATPSVAAEIVAKNKTDLEEKINIFKTTLINKIENLINVYEEKINYFKTCRALSKPYLIYEDKIQYIDDLKEKIFLYIKNIIEIKNHNLQLKIQKLDLLSPLKILQRGYSVCFDKQGKIIKTKKQVNVEDIIDIKLSDGKIKTKVVEE